MKELHYMPNKVRFLQHINHLNFIYIPFYNKLNAIQRVLQMINKCINCIRRQMYTKMPKLKLYDL